MYFYVAEINKTFLITFTSTPIQNPFPKYKHRSQYKVIRSRFLWNAADKGFISLKISQLVLLLGPFKQKRFAIYVSLSKYA